MDFTPFASKIISMLISGIILQIFLFKVLKNNPLKVIGSTLKKKIISCATIFILASIIVQYLDTSNISYNKIYSGIVMGIYIAVFTKIIKTENSVSMKVTK